MLYRAKVAFSPRDIDRADEYTVCRTYNFRMLTRAQDFNRLTFRVWGFTSNHEPHLFGAKVRRFRDTSLNHQSLVTVTESYRNAGILCLHEHFLNVDTGEVSYRMDFTVDRSYILDIRLCSNWCCWQSQNFVLSIRQFHISSAYCSAYLAYLCGCSLWFRKRPQWRPIALPRLQQCTLFCTKTEHGAPSLMQSRRRLTTF